MSRIGKQIVKIPLGVKVDITTPGIIKAEGSLGTQELKYDNRFFVVTQNDNTLKVTLAQGTDFAPTNLNALYGLNGALLKNLLIGVSQGFSKNLILQGVGYKVQKTQKTLTFTLGLAHKIVLEEPEDLKIECLSATEIKVSGINKMRVGEMAAVLKRLKIPDVYSNYGIKYADEKLIKKAGKAVGSKSK